MSEHRKDRFVTGSMDEMILRDSAGKIIDQRELERRRERREEREAQAQAKAKSKGKDNG
jgi:hypothetical protein